MTKESPADSRPANDGPSSAMPMAVKYNSGHRTGSIDAFGWVLEKIVSGSVSSMAELLAEISAEGQRRFGGAFLQEAERRGLTVEPIAVGPECRRPK